MEVEWEARQANTSWPEQSDGVGAAAQWCQPERMAWSGSIYGLGSLAFEPQGPV